MGEKSYNYASYQLSKSSEIIDVADALHTDWVFRGHTETGWAIESSLEREMKKRENEDPAQFEAETLKQIKLATSFSECQALDGKDDFSWLALLQHHGCKTRLVDFTESFYVALYFALQDLPDGASAVWAIRKSALDSKINSLGQDNNSSLSEEKMSRDLINRSIELPTAYENSQDKEIAIAYGKPEKSNLRMSAQEGLFLCPLNLNLPFMVNLTIGLGLTGETENTKRLNTLDDLKTESREGKVIKIILPKPKHPNLLSRLRKMKITEASLFPGLDGFARSLNYHAIGME